MRSTLFRLSVALFAFVLGVLTATAFAGLFGLGRSRVEVREFNHAAPPPEERMQGCRSKRLRGLSEPPPPPAPRPAQQPRPVLRGTAHQVGPEAGVVVTEAPTEVIIERR